ncbi:MAG: GYDIA family GHMP kinase [Mariniphaga sp.]
MKTFISQTKLMLTGEYLVLKGALSLALPLRFTQKLTVTEHEGIPSVRWKSMINTKLWFNSTLLLPDFRIAETNIPQLSETLVQILKTAKLLNPNFLKNSTDYQVTSFMDFDPAWGIGSSSSLISNIAYWAECDPFELNNRIFNGSGYDIACARSESPIIFNLSEKRPVYRNSGFDPSFRNQIYFIYLNRKQNSKEAIQKLDFSSANASALSAISEITLAMEQTKDLETFEQLMTLHEEIISNIVQIKPIKLLYFNDFNGSIKSLGAWGGDYIMAVSSESEAYVRDYFNSKNLNTIFRFDEIAMFH